MTFNNIVLLSALRHSIFGRTRTGNLIWDGRENTANMGWEIDFFICFLFVSNLDGSNFPNRVRFY